MLDKENKQKIDDLRQILVGKVTDPRSQVEQITNALLYKFMNDMDKESVSLGGVPSYFINEYKKYSWKILLDKKTSGEERVRIYAEALEKMYFNENLPQTFREIFKNSTLPFKEAKVFNKFITRVNDFEYSNSESLGNAFEYLLSFMGKQGDAGQFRTPRHIIDFLVELINPEKKDKILDPASGTAGFLISAYKYILNQNKKKSPGDLLNANDRKIIATNLNGYDISPEFLKVSLMNMFLHKFNNPNIYEYDTLSDESKWNEYFDVILANPPFFSPKGGITPHNRFSIKSKRAEVLFIDYIDEHLKPGGRAGVIVPEGVIFRNDAGYKQLRIKLIKNSLIGIISLPAGIFQPYSGVKTSIIILDKKIKKETDYIYFAKINNDGFSLSTNRNPIDENDIPDMLSRIKNLDFSEEIKLKKIIKNKILDGNIREHIGEHTQNETLFKKKYLEEISEIQSGNPAPQDKNLFINGTHPFIRTSDVGLIKNGSIYSSRDYLNNDGIKNLKKFPRGSILFPKSGASTLLNHRVIMDIDSYASSHLAIIKANSDKVLDKYLFYLLSKIDTKNLVANPSYPSLNLEEIKKIEIPVPDLKIQKKIVLELDELKKVVNGCKQVLENYKTSIDIDSGWKNVELGTIANFSQGVQVPVGKQFKDKNNRNRFLRIIDFTQGEQGPRFVDEKNKNFFLNMNEFAMVRYGASYGYICTGLEGILANNLFKIKLKKQNILLSKYVLYSLESVEIQKEIKNLSQSSSMPALNFISMKKLKIPCPSISVQKKIIDEIDNEKQLVIKLKKTMTKYNSKIDKKIASLWEN